MTEHNQSKTVESAEDYKAKFGTCGSDSNPERGCTDKVAEGPIEEFSQWLNQQVEAMDPLPTAEEAEFGELHRPRRGQFQFCELVDDQSGDLIGVLEEEGR